MVKSLIRHYCTLEKMLMTQYNKIVDIVAFNKGGVTWKK